MRWIRAGALTLAVAATAFAQNAPPSASAQPAPVAPAQAPRPGFVVVLDAAHGGSDTGAKLTNDLAEKTVTLGLSIRLRSSLQARGVSVVTTRETDASLLSLNRAETANHEQAAACILIHATATGSGVHLYTSPVAPSGPARPVSWQAAQGVYATQSLKLESEIDSALAHAQIPVTLGRASVQPMDNLACPAVAVELAPLVAGHVTQGKAVSDADYQKSVVDALAAGLESWRSDWKQ